MKEVNNDELNELMTMCQKYLGLKPYNDSTNFVAHDSYFYQSIVDKFGEEAVRDMIDSLTYPTYDKELILCNANSENIYSTLHINAKSISIHQSEIDLTFDTTSDVLERVQYLEINGVKFKRVS